ncbi:hypothetical protein [Mesorhizobium sp. A623]
MRKAFLLAASITLIGAFAANAQDSSTSQSPSQPPAQPPASSEAAPQIQRVNVIDVSELPQDTQKQVEQIVAQSTDESLKQMQSSIEATPQAKAALEAKGATSAQVVATNLGTDGTLTLITKKTS